MKRHEKKQNILYIEPIWKTKLETDEAHSGIASSSTTRQAMLWNPQGSREGQKWRGENDTKRRKNMGRTVKVVLGLGKVDGYCPGLDSDSKWGRWWWWLFLWWKDTVFFMQWLVSIKFIKSISCNCYHEHHDHVVSSCTFLFYALLLNVSPLKPRDRKSVV